MQTAAECEAVGGLPSRFVASSLLMRLLLGLQMLSASPKGLCQPQQSAFQKRWKPLPLPSRPFFVLRAGTSLGCRRIRSEGLGLVARIPPDQSGLHRWRPAVPQRHQAPPGMRAKLRSRYLGAQRGPRRSQLTDVPVLKVRDESRPGRRSQCCLPRHGYGRRDGWMRRNGCECPLLSCPSQT